MKSSFHSASEKAVLFLSIALEKDGIKTKKHSALVRPNASLTVGRERNFHKHVLLVECSQEILITYVNFCADKFPDTFLNFLTLPEDNKAA